jgi:hypothetical protein
MSAWSDLSRSSFRDERLVNLVPCASFSCNFTRPR